MGLLQRTPVAEHPSEEPTPLPNRLRYPIIDETVGELRPHLDWKRVWNSRRLEAMTGLHRMLEHQHLWMYQKSWETAGLSSRTDVVIKFRFDSPSLESAFDPSA